MKVHLTLTTSISFVVLPTSGKRLNGLADINLAVYFVGYAVDNHKTPPPNG
jgi:hypothetical protein